MFGCFAHHFCKDRHCCLVVSLGCETTRYHLVAWIEALLVWVVCFFRTLFVVVGQGQVPRALPNDSVSKPCARRQAGTRRRGGFDAFLQNNVGFASPLGRAAEVNAVRMSVSHCRLGQYFFIFPRRSSNLGTPCRPTPRLCTHCILSRIVVYPTLQARPAGPASNGTERNRTEPNRTETKRTEPTRPDPTSEI